MLYNNIRDPRKNKDIQKCIPLVDSVTHVDHFKYKIRTHYATRDALSGAEIAGMREGATQASFNNLLDEIRDDLIRAGFNDADIANIEFADAYDAIREDQLRKNNGKSCQSEWWSAVWGVYNTWMLNEIKWTSGQKTMFNKLFTTKNLTR